PTLSPYPTLFRSPPDRVELLADREVCRELFRKLALEARLGRLARFLLPARELPQPFEVGAAPALRDQVAPRLVPDERRGDLEHEGHGTPLGRGDGRAEASHRTARALRL